ncbi:MAG TPA: hypothetical protein VNZ52_11570 [Candidatus Thermoplasmatota archaeon]|nr:hypothetical protein [Candidatus Thermoplasmatota archaeon]
MAQLVRVLDERKWALRCFYTDLISVLLVMSLGIALVVDSYYIGYHTFDAVNDPNALHDRDVVFYRMIFEAMGFALSFGWLVYRLVTSGYKSITRNI